MQNVVSVKLIKIIVLNVILIDLKLQHVIANKVIMKMQNLNVNNAIVFVKRAKILMIV